MTIYNDNIARPYVYKITFLSGEYYYGYREKNANPNYKLIPAHRDIGSKYFSSSEIIQERGFENSTIEILSEFDGENAGDRAFEHEQFLIWLSWDDRLLLNENVRWPIKEGKRFKGVSHKQPKGSDCKLYMKKRKPEHVEKWTGENHPKYDHKIYEWIHEEYGEFIGTKVELRIKFDFMKLETSSLGKVVTEEYTHHKGWQLKNSNAIGTYRHKYKKER